MRKNIKYTINNHYDINEKNYLLPEIWKEIA
jgi:hypothetical protein